MVKVLRPMLQNELKTNSVNLQFAVVTGCLCVTKEEIYIGLNNPMVYTVYSVNQSDAIGFTEEKLRLLLPDSDVPDHFEAVRK